MANIALGLPTFAGLEDEDIDSHIHLFRGYLHAIGVDPVANGDQALGIFRACFKGEAGVWYDEHILGKNWQLYHLFNNHGQADIAGIRGRSMAQLNATASLRIGSEAHTYANIGGNNAILVSAAGSLTRPAVNGQNLWIPVIAFDQDWSLLGGRPTSENNHVANPGNNRPITLDGITIGQAVYFFRNNYPTVLDDRRRVRFNSLYQDNDSIRVFYNKIKKYGKSLKLSQIAIEDQLFRGMSPDSQLEADRIGPERPIDELVDSLERVEKRKSEMRLGISSKKVQQSRFSQDIIPVSLPPVSQQEPVVLKPVTSQEITQEKLDQLLKMHTDNLMQTFQTQLQVLQEKISQPVQQKPTIEHYPVIPQVAPELQPSKLYTGYEQKTDIEQLVKNIMERAEKRKWEKKLDTIVEGVSKLNINDSDEEYTTNLVYDEDSGNILQVRKKKQLSL
jgi:hypothetical protein